MVWPSVARSLEDIPQTDGRRRDHNRMIGPDTARALCDFVTSHGAELAEITDGDAAKERALGDMLIAATTMAASVRERDLKGMPTP
jgi:hypothetical protein